MNARVRALYVKTRDYAAQAVWVVAREAPRGKRNGVVIAIPGSAS